MQLSRSACSLRSGRATLQTLSSDLNLKLNLCQFSLDAGERHRRLSLTSKPKPLSINSAEMRQTISIDLNLNQCNLHLNQFSLDAADAHKPVQPKPSRTARRNCGGGFTDFFRISASIEVSYSACTQGYIRIPVACVRGFS